jgi:tetratricopeptide (TPR) repeat protein
LLGGYAEALTYARRTYDRTAIPAVRRAHIARLGRDSFVSAGATVALIHWAQGLPDRSAQDARNVLAAAEAGDHSVSLCLALTWCGGVIPLRLGDLQTAKHSIARLKDHAQSRGLSAYYANALCFEGKLAAKRGDVVGAERLLRAGLENLRRTQSETLYTAFLSDLAEVLALAGQLDESLAAADEALQRTERGNAFWWMPEALRIKGEVLLSSTGDSIAADEHFRRSLDLAHRQRALSWELRAATSLARLLRDRDRHADAKRLLEAVHKQFTEGFDTADLKAAETLLAMLG